MKELDILLVRPVNISQQIVPQLSLGYLATSLRRHNFSVGILDCVKSGLNYQQFQDYIYKNNPRVIGFQVFTVDLISVKRSIDIVKKVNPRAITIAGGAHPSGAPEETLTYLDRLDFGFCGEAEISIVDFMKVISKEEWDGVSLVSIPGLIWRDGQRIVKNEPKYVDNLDYLGFPSWDLLKPQTYPEAVQGYFFKRFPVAPIIATRGCPYDCTFCAAKLINAQKVRRRSIPHVMEEIKMLYYEFGIREIHIVDDNFSFYRDYIENFCKELIKLGLRISWRCANSIRLDTIDDKLLKLMKESGCYCVAFGIESGCERILKLMKKRFSIKDIQEKVALANNVGIDVNGSFIIGYPGEREDDIKRTLKFSRRLHLKMANFNCLIPLPGTEVYSELKRQGALKNLEWEDYTYSKVVYAPNGITKKKLKFYQQKAILLFYLRPQIIFNLLKSIRNFKHLYFIAKATFVYLCGLPNNTLSIKNQNKK